MSELLRAKESKARERQLLADTFPMTGKVRIKQLAAFLGIGRSTAWKMVKEGRIQSPQKLGSRTCVWGAEYVRKLAEEGIPEASQEAA